MIIEVIVILWMSPLFIDGLTAVNHCYYWVISNHKEYSTTN